MLNNYKHAHITHNFTNAYTFWNNISSWQWICTELTYQCNMVEAFSKCNRDPFNTKTVLSGIISYFKDKMPVRPSYHRNGNPYTGTTASLYWDCLQEFNFCCTFFSMRFNLWFSLHSETGSGVGVTEAPFITFSVLENLWFAEIWIRFCESWPYLSGVTTAKLWWHLSNMTVISRKWPVFWWYQKMGKLTEWEKLV